MVSVPIRSLPVMFCATSNRTVPLPVPLAPDVIVSHVAFDEAVQVQPAPAVTLTVRPVDWPFPSDRLDELSAYVHPLLCVTVWICPPMVTVAVRRGPVFALTVKLTVPLPLPLAPDVMVIHVCDATLVQVQPAIAVTPIGVALPPAAATVCAAALRLT